MPRIHTVAQDGIITAGDKLIGSDGDPNNGYVTRNYTVGGISNFVLGGTHAGSFTTITTTGNGTIGGNLSVTGDLSVTGNATIAGNLTFGDADTDTVSFSADVNSNILPDVTNFYNLGSSTKKWKDLYVDVAYIDEINSPLNYLENVNIGSSGDRYTLVNARPSSDNQFLKYTTNGATEWNDPITPITDVATFTTLNIQDPMTLSQRSYHRIILGNNTLVNSQQKAARISSYTHVDLQADADNNGITGTQQSNPVTGGDLRFLSYNTLRFLVNGDSGKIYINPKESDSLILPDARGTEGHYLKQGANGQAEWSEVAININGYTLPSAAGTAGQVLKIPSSGTQLEWANDLQSAASAVIGTGTNAVPSSANDFAVNINSTTGGMTIVTTDGATGGPNFRMSTNTIQSAFILEYDQADNTVVMQRHGSEFLVVENSLTRFKSNNLKIGSGTVSNTHVDYDDLVIDNNQNGSGIQVISNDVNGGKSTISLGKSTRKDGAQLIYDTNTEKVRVVRNGVTEMEIDNFKINFYNRLRVTGLYVYADETAAAAGGLVTGDLYRTTTGEVRIKL